MRKCRLILDWSISNNLRRLRVGLPLLMTSLLVTGGAESQILECNSAKFYLARLIFIEDSYFEKTGLGRCGVPRLQAREEVRRACVTREPRPW